MGLTRAFLFAGTPTILSSLWKVDDAATAALMTAFYRHWQDGMGKAEALQAAQAEVRANPKWAPPFFWASFVLNGDPGANSDKVSEADAQQPGSSLLLILLVVSILALGLGILTIILLRRRVSPNRRGSGGVS